MKKKILYYASTVCLTLILLIPAVSQASSFNPLADSTISLNGFFMKGDSSLLTDGQVKEGTQWSTKSVAWLGLNPSIEIDLHGVTKISSLSIQADSNDAYQVDYWDKASSSWQHAWTVANVKDKEHNYVPGLVLRESGSDLNIVSDKLKISALSGDGMYSVSEVQAKGSPTPLPSALLLLGSGLGGLAFLRKRFNM
ncbi:hypothetical protein [Desulfovibrio gilichinskyi]|uniref:PEP-CTERM protein-sorting domain-containing protein n=1 Tax=Desulfovibrio gilichinskyi TaxID=1519643 RepID=A0A1X7CJ14_9BACT|nr:hypothetical protein [Desulfovibrio gilichinskyi]SME97373.1 PEP-CTERM protein-sorting domain-containing protein [Desulfovibrio gilichinskyi]